MQWWNKNFKSTLDYEVKYDSSCTKTYCLKIRLFKVFTYPQCLDWYSIILFKCQWPKWSFTMSYLHLYSFTFTFFPLNPFLIFTTFSFYIPSFFLWSLLPVLFLFPNSLLFLCIFNVSVSLLFYLFCSWVRVIPLFPFFFLLFLSLR